MTAAADRYDRLFAAHYTWMLGGDLTALAADQARLLKDHGVVPGPAGTLAIDLGCGPGQQSLALADLGFSPVLAVDTSQALLDELTLHAGGSADIRPLRVDIRGVLPQHTRPGSVAAVVCMGDTLTHLPSAQDVTKLISEIADCLAPGGRLAPTYRDLTTPLTGTDRFLPVRATEDRIMTCFLEYGDKTTVTVHDLIHTRAGGGWTLQTSSYPKLRLSPAWLAGHCRAGGLHVQHNTTGPRGLRLVTAVRKAE